MEVRFGDTGGINDDKRAIYRVGPLRCYGDILFDNTVTFRKLDANLELPPLYSEFAFDMSFIFRTTITDAAFTDGYVGCLSNLLINGVVQDMRGLVERGVYTYGLSAGCKPKCASNPCLNRGECVEYYSHYFCECGLTPYRGFICGRQIGGTFNSGPMVKIFLDRPKDRLGTVEEYIQVGFKTKSKRGILMEMRGEGESNYIIVKVNNNGGITIEFDIGFKRYEVTTNYDVDLTNDQHHMVYAWRTDLGTKWHLKVDDYNEVVEDFSNLLSPTADVRLDDPYVLYMGRNDTMQPADGFDGCIYAAQWNNIFPLHLIYEEPRNASVVMLPADSVREDLCGFIEILPEEEPVEIRPSPAIPTNITFPEITDDAEREKRIIAGVVSGVILILSVIILVLFCRHFTFEQGDYRTREAKGASRMKTADMAIQYGRTGQPEVQGKEWWI
ncbi:contactin associated protein-like 2 [Schistosoma bovis]|uniref:Contactin associated protein-like 2 n=1 Tax=Schistosoma bovis TaxID=6184 RepID=A0A430Q541_SCHBO|nr:contactin associated protein-like 2 [Schistosoma bovis]